MHQDEKVFTRNVNFAERIIDGEALLVPVCKTDTEVNAMYALNEMATVMWGLIDGKRSVHGIKEHILQQYEVSEEQLTRSLDEFIKDLISIKAIQ